MPTSRGPRFRWFAWHPVRTQDRGWRWLCMLWRWRFSIDIDQYSSSCWRHSVKDNL